MLTRFLATCSVVVPMFKTTEELSLIISQTLSAIDKDGTLLDFDHDELMVTKTIYQQSRKIILIADANKFERKAPMLQRI